MCGFCKMKNKHGKFDLKTDSKVSAPLKGNINLKNREQLRLKLKDLLEKDQLLTSDKRKIKAVPGVSKTVNKNTNMANKQVTDFQKSNGIKKKKVEQPPINAALKRKQMEKSIPSKKVFKTMSPSQDSPANIHSKKGKPNISVQKLSSPEKVQKRVENKSFIKPKRKIAQVLPKAKASHISVTSSVEKQELQNAKNRTKQIVEKMEQNEWDYRGPLRPLSPESSENDSNMLSIGIPREDDQESQSDGSWKNSDSDTNSGSPTSSDATIYDEDFISSEFDCSSTDSLCDYESDSQSDGFQNFSEQDTDSTYRLPEDVPEDIYVAKGAAIKHDLSESTEIAFDSDDSCPQIIEIMSKNKQQELHNALTWKDECNGNKLVESIEKGYDSADSCPELVPIGLDFNIESDYDSETCSSCARDDYSDVNIDENTNQNIHMVPEVFQADKNASSDFDNSLVNTSDTVSEYEIEGSPLERISNINATKAAYNVITVKNKKLIFDHERKVNGLPKANIADANNEVNKDYGNLSQSNFAVKSKPLKHQVSNGNLTEEPHTLDLDSSKAHTVSARENEAQTRSDNLLHPVVCQDEYAAVNDSIKNKTQLKTLFYNAVNSNQVIVLLKDPLYIYGTLKLKLLAGGLDIFGYNPKPNEVLEVFSPRGYSSLKMEPSVRRHSHPIDENEFNALASIFLKIDIENVRENFDCKQDAIIILERNDNSKKVNMLRKYMVENLFPNMNLLQSDRPFYASEFLLRCVLTPTVDKPLIINPIWRTISVNNASRIVVIGGKSVGKTTLVRFLSNVYLNKSPKVLLIDLDIGQPEMFVPQTVSATTLTAPLLGPGYLSVKEPDKAFLVGQTNVLLPQHYIQCVHALISFCRQNADYEKIPWIVNTMGYNKGFGDEIIAVICRFLNPSNIVQLESKNEINNFDVIMSKENLKSMQFDIIGDMFHNAADYHPDHVLTLMSSVVSPKKKYQNDWELKPRDMRLAMIISRLSAVLNGQAEWLSDIKPLCASTDDLKLVNLGDEDLNTEDLLKSLVGNIVYMCKQSSNSSIECIGIGIVRGIDFPLKQIYLLPAVSMKLMQEVNCLAICGIPLPSSILINQGPKVKGVASYVYNTIHRSSSMHIKQIYHRPQHFLTGKFKSVID